jgi:hypothetical protein
MGGWKKFEPFWNFMIRYGNLNRMLPVLEYILSNTKSRKTALLPKLTLTTGMNSLVGKAAL